MAKFSLKPITDERWILSSAGNRIALLYKKDDGITAIGSITQKKFKDLDDLAKVLGGKMAIEESTSAETISEETGQVFGYPIKHDQVFDAQEDPIPNYKRRSNSDIRFAAGYYGVLFPNGWVSSFCPKLTTLAQYSYIGPFATKLEMNHEISCQKKVIDE